MASTSSSDSVFGPNTGIVPGPTRMASATSTLEEDVTGGTNTSGVPAAGLERCAADSVPPMPVDEWQAAPPVPAASEGGSGGTEAWYGPGSRSVQAAPAASRSEPSVTAAIAGVFTGPLRAERRPTPGGACDWRALAAAGGTATAA